jgi:exocyst complex component 3
VVETLLATFEDYYSDLKRWISSSFFFAKLVRQSLDRCAKEYVKRLLIRTHCFPSPPAAATTVETDMKNIVAFFTGYAAELKRTGLRTEADIKNEFATFQFISDSLKGTAPEVVAEEHREAVQHIRKLLRSTSNQEAALMSDKGTKKKKDKTSKEKEKPKEKEKKEKPPKKDKTSKSKDKAKDAAVAAAVAAKSRGNSFPEADNDATFEVQKLNMADFLGSS